MKFSDYSERYSTMKLERDDQGILLITVHTDGGPLQWGKIPHEEWPRAFGHIASDLANRVIILTGTGAEFSGPRPPATARQTRPVPEMDRIVWEGRHLLGNLLKIEAPIISAINGPAIRHSEIPLLSDIVLASENVIFEDAGHFESGLVPGDGVNLVYPMLLGLNRARYFMLTSQQIGAQEAKELGLVNEVLTADRLMPRAWELARMFAKHPDMHLRNTRNVMTLELRQKLEAVLGYSLTLEAMAICGRPQSQLPLGTN